MKKTVLNRYDDLMDDDTPPSPDCEGCSDDAEPWERCAPCYKEMRDNADDRKAVAAGER